MDIRISKTNFYTFQPTALNLYAMGYYTTRATFLGCSELDVVLILNLPSSDNAPFLFLGTKSIFSPIINNFILFYSLIPTECQSIER